MKQLAFVAVAIAALAAAAALRGPIERQRARHRLVTATADREIVKDPKVMLLQVAPGGLRAVAFHYLWVRSQDLKQEGKIYDAMQLRELICDMMPHFPGVWGHLSWDMAWNISVSRHTPEERWMWVYNGIRLLRDKGLYYNPDDLLLYKQLSWTFFSKMGQYTDEMHWTYKKRWAEEMDWVLGSPPAGTTEDAIAHFARVAEAPRTVEALSADADAAAFLARVAAAGASVDGSLLRYYNRFSDDPLSGQLSPEPREPGEGEQAVADLMADPSPAAGRDKTIAFCRRKVLVEQYKMDPDWMLALMKHYGPFDWRNVNAHAAYWASLGLHRAVKLDLADIHPGRAEASSVGLDQKVSAAESVVELAESGVNISEYNRLTVERYVLFALRAMSQTGQLYFGVRPDDNAPSGRVVEMLWAPDYRFIEAVHREYLAGGKALVGPNYDVDHETNTFRDGHIVYLTDAVQMLYISGQRERAQHYFDEMNRRLKPDKDIYKNDLDTFVTQSINAGGVPIPEMFLAFRTGALGRVYRALAEGNVDEARNARAFARKVHAIYANAMKNIPRNQPAAFDAYEKSYLETLMMQEQAVGMTFRDPILSKSRIYKLVSPDLQQAIYPLIAEQLRDEVRRRGFDFDRAFPAPPGVAPTPAAS